jgi:hypothetical protein
MMVAPACALATPAAEAAALAQRLYRTGVLSDGRTVTGRREGFSPIEGAAAACINCHRRSGLGEVEGRTRVPPITAKYLARARAALSTDALVPRADYTSGSGWVYSDAALARAVREGVRPDGRSLSPLMPRYELPEADMRGLIAYLRQLGSKPVPGVSAAELRFATVVTPEADPTSRAAMLEVLQKFFALEQRQVAGEKHGVWSRRANRSGRVRDWTLQVWALTGAPETWRSQLDAYNATQPVFAVLAGIGGRHWAPVHEFCEQREVPCLFPNVPVPMLAETDFFSIYYSRGVYLEADLAMQQLRTAIAARDWRPSRLVQIFRSDDAGADGAAALGAQAQSAALQVHSLALSRATPETLSEALG